MAEFGDPLSEREIQVLEQVATGATNRQVAQTLVVSVNTVKVHLRNIYVKLGVESRTEATLTAIREGLVSIAGAELQAPVPEAPPSLEELPPAAVEGQPAGLPAEVLPPLPWPKRLAFVSSLLLVVLVSIVTWPRPQTAAGQPLDETDNPVNGGPSVNAADQSTGWRALAPMVTARSRFALVVTADGRLYAIGGETVGGKTGSVECYDPGTDRWTPLPASKPTRVSNIGAAVLGEWIYVPGGLTVEGKPSAVVEAFSLVDKVWSQVASLPRPLSSYALAVCNGQLYLFGGKDNHGYVNVTYIYDPQQDKWQAGKAMPTGRAYAAAATLGSRIFVIGGYNGRREQSTCAVYRPERDAWESCEPLILGRGGLGLAGVANRLYAVGGGWSNYLGFSEEYDPDHDARKFFETPVSRQWRNLAIASLPHKFYVAGGWNGNYLNGVWEYVVLTHQLFLPATP